MKAPAVLNCYDDFKEIDAQFDQFRYDSRHRWRAHKNAFCGHFENRRSGRIHDAEIDVCRMQNSSSGWPGRLQVRLFLSFSLSLFKRPTHFYFMPVMLYACHLLSSDLIFLNIELKLSHLVGDEFSKLDDWPIWSSVEIGFKHLLRLKLVNLLKELISYCWMNKRP